MNWMVLERPVATECPWCRGTGKDYSSIDGVHADPCTRCDGTGHEDGAA